MLPEGGESMNYSKEEAIFLKAEGYYQAFPGYVGVYEIMDSDNSNHRVIKGLCQSIVSIWNEWQRDTRHYKPARKKYLSYSGALERAKDLLDPEAPEYETARQVTEDYKTFIDRVVLYRVPNGICRVM